MKQMIPPYNTPQHLLYFHAEDGNFDALESVITQGGIDINAKDDYGWTALSLAASHGRTDCVRLLLEHGAAPCLANDGDGWTPLIHAAHASDNKAMRLLIEKGANIHARDAEDGRTALLWCASWGDCAGIEVLMEAGARLYDRDNRGETAVSLAEKRMQSGDLARFKQAVEHQKNRLQHYRSYLKNRHLKR